MKQRLRTVMTHSPRRMFASVASSVTVLFLLVSAVTPSRAGYVLSPGLKGKIVAMVDTGGEFNLDDFEIYLVDADGKGTPLTQNTAFDGYPSWSPNGKQITFSSTRDGNWEIYVMDADGANQTNITNTPTVDEIFPTWSPNGKQLAVTADKDGNFDFFANTWADADIFVMDADGGNPTNITNNDVEDYGAVWSHNGKKLAFSTLRDGNNEIYVMDIDGSNPINLTNNAASDGFWAPSWSPNGKQIAFISNRDGNFEVHVMEADGSNQTNLTNHAASDAAPIWSPNGQRIAFRSDRDGNQEIYVMDADGSNQTRITDTAYSELLFDWTQGNTPAAVAPAPFSSADRSSHFSMARVMR